MFKHVVALVLLVLSFPVAAWAANRKIDISITEKGFGPDRIQVKKGEVVTLAFTRKTDKTCAKQVVIQLGEGKKIERKLPLNETVEVEAAFPVSGEIHYGCGMDMITGVIVVQ